MSGVTTDTDTNTDLETSNTSGIIGYSTSYISLQAVNGVYINAIGMDETTGQPNTPPSFPLASTTKGDFYISGRNGASRIHCRDRNPGDHPNGPGIGSIFIEANNGDVIVNVPNGNFETNVAGDTTNNNQGNVTNYTTGNQVSHIHGDQTTHTTGNQTSYTTGDQKSYTTGNQFAWAMGNQTQVTLDTNNTIVLGDLNQLVEGVCTQIVLDDQLNFNAGGLQNVVLGQILDLYIGAHNTVTVGFLTEDHPIGKASASELEAKEVQAKLANHTVLIENASTVARDCAAVLQSAGIHVFT